MQAEIDVIKLRSEELSDSVFLTRQQAANLMKISLRQFDRCCCSYGIRKERTMGGIRVRKSDVMAHLETMETGVIRSSSELDLILKGRS